MGDYNMENDTIVKFYAAVNKFIRSFSDEISKSYDEQKIFQIIRDIPKIIDGFVDCTNDEKNRMMATKNNANPDQNIAYIQVVDTNTGYKVYHPISSDEYKNFYFECLMYALILYELNWKNCEYVLTNGYNLAKEGELEIPEKALPHLLGIDAKYIGNCQLLENLIPEYNGKSPIEQIMLIIENYEKIKNYEYENGIEIFNYYKSMQKVKSFLLLGRFFSNFDDADQNKVLVIDKNDSTNQLWLVKKSNMNSTMTNNIIQILLQKSSGSGKFFPRSLQSISDQLEMNYLAGTYIKKGVPIDTLTSMTDAEKLMLLNKGLLTGRNLVGIKLKTGPIINPRLCFETLFSSPAIHLDELEFVCQYLSSEQNFVSLNKKK